MVSVLGFFSCHVLVILPSKLEIFLFSSYLSMVELDKRN
jgi:hypothetical protein